MAHRRGFGEFADIMLRSHLQRRNQQQDQEAQDEQRQALLQDQQMFAQDQQRRQQENTGQEQVLGKALTDPWLAKRLAAIGQRPGGIDPRVLQQSPEEATGNVASEIAKAPSLSQVPTPSDVLGLTKGQPGFKNEMDPTDQLMQPSAGPGLSPVRSAMPPIEQLMKQAQAKKEAQLAALPRREVQGAIQPDGSAATLVQDPMKEGVTKTGFSPSEVTGQAVGRQAALMPGAIKQAGQEAGARSAAEFPWQSKLAQTRADMSLANATSLDDYKRTHPKATAAQLDQRSGATHALTMIDQVRQLEAEMERRGMMGALTGRVVKTAEGDIKSENLFSNPADAQLAANYFSEMSLLAKLAARVHGGQRAAGSPQMSAVFDKIISGIGDPSIVTGQLDAVKNVMKIYEDNPDAPALINIPGLSSQPDPLSSFKSKLGIQ